MSEQLRIVRWSASQRWAEPDQTVSPRARTWLNRVTGFDEKISALESQISAIALQIDAILVSISAIEARLLALESSGIVEADSDYTVQAADKIIACLGTFNVTLVDIDDAVAPITITSTAGTIEVVGDAAIQSPVALTTGSSMTLYPARGSWHQS